MGQPHRNRAGLETPRPLNRIWWEGTFREEAPNPLALTGLSSALPQHRRDRDPQGPSCQHLRGPEPSSLCRGERQSKAAS